VAYLKSTVGKSDCLCGAGGPAKQDRYVSVGDLAAITFVPLAIPTKLVPEVRQNKTVTSQWAT
jgi:hypothetical protein